MAEDIPVTGPGGTPPRPAFEGPYPRYGLGYEAIPPAAARRVSWGAIFAGFVVALVVQLLLGMLGLSILMGTIDPATDVRPLQGVGVGTGIWLAVSAILAFFFGGWTAGRLAGQPSRFDGLMHGVVSWGLVTLFSTWMLTNFVGSVVSGAFGLVGSTLGLVGGGVAAVAPAAVGAVGPDGQVNVGAEIERFLQQTGDPQLAPDALRARAEAAQEQALDATAAPTGNAFDAISGALSRLGAQGQAVVNEVDRQDAINVIVARTDLNEAQAAQVVDNWIGTWNNLRAQIPTTQEVGQTAAQVTEDVTDAFGSFLAWTFVAMLVGVIAAAVGGSVGAPKVPLAVATAATPTVTTNPVREH